MATSRLLLGSLTRRFGFSNRYPSKFLQSGEVAPSLQYSMRYFSKDGDGKSGKEDKHDDDPFGVNFEDGTDHGKLGPSLPPRYKRDSMTGKFTLEEQQELTSEEKKLINMDPIEEQDYLLEQFMKDDGATNSDRVANLAERIRQDNMGLNTLGRSVTAQSAKGTTGDGEAAHEDKTGFSKPLSPSEFKVFQKHMSDEYKSDIGEDDIPVETYTQGDDSLDSFADNDYLNTKWMSSRAVRFMDDTKDDDPFSDLMPRDLNPARLVDRRRAKPIPKQLLHHTNLALLRRYITPTGQIMNRVQSRLGAKDQRKVAKLIKRARHMGLIPHEGQFAVELHGNTKERDIDSEREWETELSRRGLVIGRNKSATKKD